MGVQKPDKMGFTRIENTFEGRFSCFVLPSITEQWGLVVNESLASGKPVIVSNRCGSAPNLVEDKDVGKIKIKKSVPGKKITSIEVLVKIANNN